MKITLAKNLELASDHPPTETFQKKLHWNPLQIERASTEVGHCAERNLIDLITKIRLLAQDQFNRHVNMSFQILDTEANSSNKRMMNVIVDSSLLSDTHLMIHQGDLDENLKLSLSAVVRHNEVKLDTLAFLPFCKSVRKGEMQRYHIRYIAKNVQIPAGFFDADSLSGSSWKADVSLELEVNKDDFINVWGLYQQLLTLNRRLLKMKDSVDLTLVSGDGYKVSCHKLFVAAHSQAFEQLIAKNQQDATKPSYLKNRLDLPQLSQNGLIALVDYMYFQGLTKPKRDSKVALELYKAALYYAIEPLEHLMTALIKLRDADWFDLGSVLYLYLYVKKLPALEEIKEKIAEVVIAKRHELADSVLYKDAVFDKETCLELLGVIIQPGWKLGNTIAPAV